MRARDAARLEALRLLQAAIQRREVDERVVLDDLQVTAVIDKLVKQSNEAVEQFEKGARQDLAEKEHFQIEQWKQYLPQPLSESEVDALIAAAVGATGAASLKDMGKVMAELKPKLQGRADMGRVGAKVKSRLGA
jgi:hypothetical protein